MSAVRYERVWVIGGPGTGKTTFARRYAELSGSPCVVLDEHFWLDDWVQASDAAFAQALEAALAGGRWVVDGDYPVVVDRFLDRAECLVWLEPPFLVSYGRLVRRTLTRLVTREPMWSTSNNRESVRSVFGPRSILVYAIRTREEQRARAEHAAAAVRAGGRPVFRLRRTDPTAAATELALGTLEATVPANLELSRYGSAADVPAAEWDALTDGATTYLSHAWLRVREAELPAGAVVRHVLVRADGGPVAKASLQLFRSPPHPLYSPAALLGAGVGRPDEPVAFAAGWSEFRGELPGPAGGTPHRRVALERVVAEAMELAATGGARLLCFGFVPLDVAAELRTVLPADRTAVLYQDAECVLDTSWKTFEDYLEWLPRNRRTRARAEARRFEAAGLRLRELPLSAALDAIVPLNTALMRKYGHDVDETRIRAVYTNQARHLDPVSSVLLAEDPDGGCRGFSLRYRLGDALYSRVVGFDYTRPSVGQYFTLMVYDPVRAGVGLGVDRINLGVGTYEAKLGRGAHPRPLYHVLVGVDDAPGWDPRALERDARERIRAFVDRYGRLVVGPFDPDSWFLAG